MKIIRHLADLKMLPGRSVVTIGNFDGVHLAHQTLLKAVVNGARAESAVPVLARAAASSDAAVAGQASIALAAVGAPAGLWLGAALSSANPASRAGAAKILSSLAPPPEEAAGALIGALDDADPKVREHIFQ